MQKVCWFLIVVLLLGCFAGCQAAPVEGAERSIENEDGTLSDWMKEEIKEAWERKYGLGSAYYPGWWSPEHPEYTARMYLGTYNGYVMFSTGTGCEAIMNWKIAGYEFTFSQLLDFYAYKDDEFYMLRDLYDQGLLDEEAIRIAYEHHTQIEEIRREYRKQQEKSDE